MTDMHNVTFWKTCFQLFLTWAFFYVSMMNYIFFLKSSLLKPSKKLELDLNADVKVTNPFQFDAEALVPGLIAHVSPVCVSNNPAVHLEHHAYLRLGHTHTYTTTTAPVKTNKRDFFR